MSEDRPETYAEMEALVRRLSDPERIDGEHPEQMLEVYARSPLIADVMALRVALANLQNLLAPDADWEGTPHGEVAHKHLPVPVSHLEYSIEEAIEAAAIILWERVNCKCGYCQSERLARAAKYN